MMTLLRVWILSLVLLTFLVLGQQHATAIAIHDPSQTGFKIDVKYPAIRAKDLPDLQREWESNIEESWIIESFTASGIPVYCEMPNINFDESGDSHAPKEAAKPAFHYLMPLKGSCITYIDGWWTYEFCFAKYVRQYHVGQNGKIEADYFLGKAIAPEDHHYSWISIDDDEEDENSGTNAEGDSAISKLLEHIAVDSDSDAYYAEKFTQGTPCDIQSSPRSIEIRWYCNPSATVSHIRAIKEPASCQYLMEINSPLLCQHPKYRAEDQVFHKMKCNVITSDDDLAPPVAKRSEPTIQHPPAFDKGYHEPSGLRLQSMNPTTIIESGGITYKVFETTTTEPLTMDEIQEIAMQHLQELEEQQDFLDASTGSETPNTADSATTNNQPMDFDQNDQAQDALISRADSVAMNGEFNAPHVQPSDKDTQRFERAPTHNSDNTYASEQNPQVASNNLEPVSKTPSPVTSSSEPSSTFSSSVTASSSTPTAGSTETQEQKQEDSYNQAKL